MQINFNQTEIEQALKNYINEQGIGLYGKIVTLAFTAGRKAAGLSVEVNIEEDAHFNYNASVMLGQVMMDPVNSVSSQVETLRVTEDIPVDVQDPEPALAVEGTEVIAKTTSLFA